MLSLTAERQVAQLIQDHKLDMGQALGDLSDHAQRLIPFQRVHHLEGGEEAHTAVVVRTSCVPGTAQVARGCEEAAFAARSTAHPGCRVIRTAGIVTLRQQPSTANWTVFVSHEFGAVYVFGCSALREEQRQALLDSRVLAVKGWSASGANGQFDRGNANGSHALARETWKAGESGFSLADVAVSRQHIDRMYKP